VHLTLRVSPARRLRSSLIACRQRGSWDPYPSATELAVAGGDGGRRSSARICPRTRPGLAPRSMAARWATTASLRGRAHQGVAATPAEAGTTGGGGLVSQTREAGGPGENLAVLGVPWLPFKCQQQATPSMPSPTSATCSRSG